MNDYEPHHTKNHRNEEARLVALEHGQQVHAQQIETLAETIAQQGRQFQESVEKQRRDLADTMARQAEEARRQFHDLHLDIAELARPKWNTYIAAAVFCLALITACGGAALAPLYLTTNLLWKNVEKTESAIESHLANGEHLRASVHLKQLGQRLNQIEEHSDRFSRSKRSDP